MVDMICPCMKESSRFLTICWSTAFSEILCHSFGAFECNTHVGHHIHCPWGRGAHDDSPHARHVVQLCQSIHRLPRRLHALQQRHVVRSTGCHMHMLRHASIVRIVPFAATSQPSPRNNTPARYVEVICSRRCDSKLQRLGKFACTRNEIIGVPCANGCPIVQTTRLADHIPR